MDLKDFETDDFANDKEIVRLRKIDEDYHKLMEDCIVILSEKLSLEENICDDITSFELFRSVENAELLTSFRSVRPDLPLQVFFIENTWVHQTAKSRQEGIEHMFMGLLTLRGEYPLTYVYKETIREKIVDWFVKGDIDFKEQKKFSSQFHVVTRDKERLRQLLSNKPLDDLVLFPELELEINGKACLFRVSKESLSEDATLQLAELAKLICQILL